MAHEKICALRRQIAKIEGTLPETFETAPDAGEAGGALIGSGVEAFDAALGGGLPCGALSEIVGAETRDAAAAAGFALALAARARRLRAEATGGDLALLWIGLAGTFSEAGFPYAPGLCRLFGLPPSSLLFSQAPRIDDTLWIAEEAARCSSFCAVILEMHGNPKRLDLTATRRLHRRAASTGLPLILLRQGARPEPSAAPVRLLVSPAPSALRRTLGGFMPQSIGPPALSVTIDKSRGHPRAAPFRLEWNRDDLAFQESRPENSGALVPASFLRPRAAPPPRRFVAFAGDTRRAG